MTWITAATLLLTTEALCMQICADVDAKFVSAQECGCVCIDSEGEFLVLTADCDDEKNDLCR